MFECDGMIGMAYPFTYSIKMIWPGHIIDTMLLYSPRHHLDVGFDTPYEVGPSRPELFHQLSQLGLELGPHRDES